jgi:hypothetical protein
MCVYQSQDVCLLSLFVFVPVRVVKRARPDGVGLFSERVTENFPSIKRTFLLPCSSCHRSEFSFFKGERLKLLCEVINSKARV